MTNLTTLRGLLERGTKGPWRLTSEGYEAKAQADITPMIQTARRETGCEDFRRARTTLAKFNALAADGADPERAKAAVERGR